MDTEEGWATALRLYGQEVLVLLFVPEPFVPDPPDERSRHRSGSGRFVQRRHRELVAERVLQPLHELEREQRVAPEIEERVVVADVADVEHFAEVPSHRRPGSLIGRWCSTRPRIRRAITVGSGDQRHGQVGRCLAIELAVRRARELVVHGEHRRSNQCR